MIVGISGAGKTTLATKMASRLRLSNATDGDCWAIDGNCVAERDIVWERADTVIWLDYSRPLIMCRVVTRNLRWLIFKKAI